MSRACAWCACVLLTVLAAPTLQSQELLAGPDFEEGLAGWDVVSPIAGKALTEPVVDEGRRCLHVAKALADDLRSVGVRQTIEAPGGLYVLSLDIRHTTLGSSGGVRVTALDAGRRALSESWPVRLYTWQSGWRHVERTVRLPGQTARIELFLAVNGLGEAWFDAVSLSSAPGAEEPAAAHAVPTGIGVTSIGAVSSIITLRVCDIEGLHVSQVVTVTSTTWSLRASMALPCGEHRQAACPATSPAETVRAMARTRLPSRPCMRMGT